MNPNTDIIDLTAEPEPKTPVLVTRARAHTFLQAARAGDLPVVQFIVESGTPITVYESQAMSEWCGNTGLGGNTPFDLAVENDQVPVVKYLIEQGVQPTQRHLTMALTVSHRLVSLVKTLLDAPAGLNPTQGLNILIRAGLSRPPCPEIVKLLLDAGANPNPEGIFFLHRLSSGTLSGNCGIDTRLQILQMLVDAGANFQAVDTSVPYSGPTTPKHAYQIHPRIAAFFQAKEDEISALNSTFKRARTAEPETDDA